MTSSAFTRRRCVQFSRCRLMTRSPGFTCVTPAPTAATRPTHSAPGVAGSGGRSRYVPRQNEMSAGLIGNSEHVEDDLARARRADVRHVGAAHDLLWRAVAIEQDLLHRAGGVQPSQSQTAPPITSSRSRPFSHGQLLGEHRHALPPRARHARDVGAPEHPRGAERVEDPLQVVVDVAIRIGLAGVARRAGGLDARRSGASPAPASAAGSTRARRRPRGRVALAARRPAQVVDDQLQPRVPLGDLPRPWAGSRRAAARPAARRARRPATASRSCRRSATSSWCGCRNVKRSPSIPGRCFQPSISPRLSGRSSGKLPRIARRVGMLTRGLHGQRVGVRVPRRRRMDDGAVDARRVHLLQQLVRRCSASTWRWFALPACRCSRCGPARRRCA